LVESMKRLCLKNVSDSQFRSMVDLYSEINTMLTGSRKRRYERALDFFDDTGILYIDDDGPIWTGSSSCLWAAPPDMITSYSLERFFTQRGCNPQQMETLEALLHKKMDIRNATLDDLLAELTELRNAGCEDVPRIVGIYRYLDEKIDASSELRIVFQESPLLFEISDGCSSWKKTADFVWVHDETGTELAASYTKLKRFFIIKLGVKVSSEELLKSPPKDVKEAKEILAVLNDMQFFTRPLYPEAGHISEKVIIAATYNSSRYLHNESAFYEQLRIMRTFESDRISSTLKVRQESNLIHSEALLGTAYAHIAENGEGLTVYVPKDSKAQEICYLSKLPKAFAQWLMPSFYDEEELTKVLTLVFASDKTILNDVLDDQGIVKLSFEDKDVIENGNSDGEEEYFDVEEPKRSKDNAPDLHNEGKDAQKAAFTQEGIFDVNELKSALPNLDKADRFLPGKGGLFGTH
ncbi:hypothetical protein KAF25_010296, partial [Fusarium avenaceum]